MVQHPQHVTSSEKTPFVLWPRFSWFPNYTAHLDPAEVTVHRKPL
jgi:hypothetical protein